MKNRYHLFESFVFRVPFLSLKDLDTTFIKTDFFKEALYLASRDLLDAMLAQGEKNFESYPLKLQLSLLKYLSRMTTRCTPFGLFAGCGIGSFTGTSQISNLTIPTYDLFKTVTRLDMDFIAIINKALTDNMEIRNKLKYFPNNSMYSVGNQFRYVEYKYFNRRRSYMITEIETNDFIMEIFVLSKSGVLISNLVEKLADNSVYNKDEIYAFVNDLIDNQILISELYPSVTGVDALERLMEFLGRDHGLEVIDNLNMFVNNIYNKLKNIDKKPIGRPYIEYQLIEEQIAMMNIAYNPKYLFQSDMFIDNAEGTLNNSIKNSIYDAAFVLNKLTFSSHPSSLKKFKESFFRRYEYEEIPLTDVLDTDVGIGFGNQTPETVGHNILLEGIILERKKIAEDVTMNAVEYMLMRKYHEFLKNTYTEIRINDEDIVNLPESYDDLPITMSSVVEIIGTEAREDAPLIFMDHIGGTSATNLLARFSQGSKSILTLVEEIVEQEKIHLNDNQIIAEIVHLPESRTGNIIFRPIMSTYEIPYLAFAGVNEENTISISDIMVSINGKGEIKLRSKSLNKEIIPKLSSAHNFVQKSLPIYHFLCMVQLDGKRTALSFNWGSILNSEKFLPRVIYKNVILSVATWRIEEEETKFIGDYESTDFEEKFLDFKKGRNLPDRCFICSGDNKLYIDFRNPLMVKLFLSELKRYKRFKVEEYLFNEKDMVIRDTLNRGYANQFVFCFKKNK